MKKSQSLTLGSLLLVASMTNVQAAGDVSANLHPKVQAALTWEVPASECGNTPKLKGASSDLAEIVDGQEIQRSYDIDYNTLARHTRRKNRWITCMTQYNQSIVDSIGMLRGSAQHGLTEAQAKQILQNMADAQAVLTEQETASR
jgi:hypothetical protein